MATSFSISVITPLYNGGEYIEEVLASVQAQTHVAVEHIVVDDGSTDSGYEIVKTFSARADNRHKITLLSQKNSGESAAVNLGFKNATGKYLVIVNADDPLLPGALASLSGALETFPRVVVAYPDWKMIDGNGQPLAIINTRNFKHESIILDFICIPGPGAMIRAAAINRSHLRDEEFKYISDFECWTYLVRQGDFVRVPKVLATWRKHVKGTTFGTRGKPFVDDIERLFLKLLREGAYVKNSERRRARATSLYIQAAQKLFSPQSIGRLLMFRALWLYPGSTLRKHGGSVVITLGVLTSPLLNLLLPGSGKLHDKLPSFLQDVSRARMGGLE